MSELKKIRKIVETFTGIDDLSVKKQSAPYFVARAIYYKLAKTRTPYHLDVIGQEVGRTHATVINGLTNLHLYLRDYPKFQEIFDFISEVDHSHSLKTIKGQHQRMLHMENEITRLQKELLDRRSDSVAPTHEPLFQLINRIPEHHVSTVALRLDAIIKMLPKTRN